MKKIVFIFYFLFFITVTFSQNLVPNYSFEDSLGCPNHFSQIYKTKHWYSPSIESTPDYMHECASSISQLSTPSNLWGYQKPRTGKAYIGIMSYLSDYNNLREYIAIRLTSKLIINKDYCVSFFVSPVNNSRYFISNIGMYLSKDSIYTNKPLPLSYVPQVKNPKGKYLNDTLNWMEIKGTYTAKGDEQFIIIGNFDTDSNIDTLRSTDTVITNMTYFYIDDVSITLCEDTTSATNISLYIPTAFSPNGDGANDTLYVRATGVKSMVLKIYNRWGELVFESDDVNKGWDGTYNNQALKNEVFGYVIEAVTNTGEKINKTGSVIVIK